MKRLIILTNHFPYYGGEQFIESEIFYWKNSKFKKISILPSITPDIANAQRLKRSVPENIEILTLKRNSIFLKIKALIVSVFSLFLLREVFYIWSLEKKNFHIKIFVAKVFIAIKVASNIILQKIKLERLIDSMAEEIYIYSYWNDSAAYAACLLKRSGKIKKIFSRAHGFDIYKERRPFSYMPFKKQFADDFDVVYCLSENAVRYYSENYMIKRSKLDIARLGVVVPESIQLRVPSYLKKIHILSISSCVKVKRIDKMIEAFKIYANTNHNLLLEWTHIGSGELFDELYLQAEYASNSLLNFKFNFLGQKTNQEVLGILRNQKFDLFINTSESEGIPVSIMEMMSYGIPGIAPNIGGISTLVNKSNGFLLSSQTNINEIIDAIDSYRINPNKEQMRLNAYLWVKQYFNAKVNYRQFVSRLEQLSN